MAIRQAVVVSRKMDTPTAVVAMLGMSFTSEFLLRPSFMGRQGGMGGAHFPR